MERRTKRIACECLINILLQKGLESCGVLKSDRMTDQKDGKVGEMIIIVNEGKVFYMLR